MAERGVSFAGHFPKHAETFHDTVFEHFGSVRDSRVDRSTFIGPYPILRMHAIDLPHHFLCCDVGMPVAVIDLEILRTQVRRLLGTPMEAGKAVEAPVAPDRPIVLHAYVPDRTNAGADAARVAALVGLVEEPILTPTDQHTEKPEQSRQHLPRFVAQEAEYERFGLEAI